MKVSFTVGIYQAKKKDGSEAWTALTPQGFACHSYGRGDVRTREHMVEMLRERLSRAAPVLQERFQLPVGTQLVRVQVDVKLDKGRVQGVVPIVAEPHLVDDDHQTLCCYHPTRRDLWFLAETHDDIAQLAPAWIRATWGDVDEDDYEDMLSDGKDRLTTIALTTEPKSLLDQLPSRKRDPRTGARASRAEKVLKDLGVDETQRAVGNALPLGVPRSPYRERLAYLMSGARPRSVAIVGPPGSGKTTLIHRWIADRLDEDGYPIHKNLDKVRHVWRLTGKRLIAGMSYLGQWEERCLAVVEDAAKNRGILWIDDLYLFGRLGQSRQSERSFADFFRGPVRRGDLSIIAELTQEQFARLERDAPGLAEALALVSVPAADAGETARLLLHETRALETRLPNLSVHPFVARTALELGTALFPWRARPGVAIEIVRRVAEQHLGELTPADVLDYLARTTGLSARLITLDEPLDEDEVEAAFARRVIGQPVATRAAAQTILKVRAGLADPHRPISVMLFTGPTGTGKTELATAIAEYLYGDQSRLVRIDMGELSGPDAVSRLIGDRWQPDGLLTSRVRAQPFCVVLLDEIEKAHPQALHLLLQLFDEGRLTDAAGEVASFASAVVIMTSNLGSRSAAPIGFGETRDRILADVAKAVREFFPVELFNRIDQVVPFEPLTPEVAAQVVDKELAKLLARRGLRERNTFVYAGQAVRRRAVDDAFDPRYGARTVKRWLEDRIGGALVDVLASAPPARLRIVRLAEDAGKIAATLEPMAEKQPASGPYLLEGALDLAVAGLEPAIARAVAVLSTMSAPRGADFWSEDLAAKLSGLRTLLGMDQRVEDDDGEPAHVQRPYSEDSDDNFRVRRQRTRHGNKPPRRIAPRDELLEGVARALLYQRALPQLHDPDAHAVTVVLSRVGATADAGGLGIAARALAQPDWLDAAAFALDGRIHEAANLQLAPQTTDICLVLRGLFVREALAGDRGTWMIRATAAEPDVIRVDIRAGGGDPVAILKAHLAARKELERVLEAGGPLPANPDVLLPVTRTLTYRPPLRVGDTYAVEIEDFATGWLDRTTVRELAHAVRRAWTLAWSRE